MRYRRLSYRYAMVIRAGPAAGPWPAERVRLLAAMHWRPDVDVSESPASVDVVVDLAGVDENEVEVQLFEDALVVEGRRQLPACQDGAVYHTATIRHGPFRLELPLPAPVDAERVEARYDRGLLCIRLPKPGSAR